MNRHLTPLELEAMLADGGELALLDMREVVPYGGGHPLRAINLPLGRLELRIDALVPRRGTRIVLTDGGDGYAARAAARLARLGYCDVSVLDGGAVAWEAAGHRLHEELEVPVKGFAGFAERNGKPRAILPDDLKAALDAGEDWVVLDSRPPDEYRKMSIPGGIDAPGPDLLRCFHDLVPSPTTKVAVNCATRTRGILGALCLRDAGVPNEVFVLRNGTRGWRLRGFDLEHGAARLASRPSAAAVTVARPRTQALRERAGIACIDLATLDRWRGDRARTTYLFDVRGGEEYEAGHLPGARSAPEGRLIMSPDSYFATFNARVVLVDDDGVRATVTALWLQQMGWCEAVVLDDGLEDGALKDGALETGPEVFAVLGLDDAPHEAVDVAALADLMAQGAARLIDLDTTDRYAEAHVPGAYWALRSGLGAALDRLPEGEGPIVLTSGDGALATLATAEAEALTSQPIRVLSGGTASWRATGRALESGSGRPLSPPDDRWLLSDERPGDERQHVIGYIDWEASLYSVIEGDGDSPYRNLLWD